MRTDLIILDGTNLAYLRWDACRDEVGPCLDCVLQVLDRFLDRGYLAETMLVVFDTRIQQRFQQANREADYERLLTYMQRGTAPIFRFMWRNVIKSVLHALGVDATSAFLIVTNDSLRDQPAWVARHRIPAFLDQNNTPQLLIESEAALQDRFHGGGGVPLRLEVSR